jgi:hypothetical protein
LQDFSEHEAEHVWDVVEQGAGQQVGVEWMKRRRMRDQRSALQRMLMPLKLTQVGCDTKATPALLQGERRFIMICLDCSLRMSKGLWHAARRGSVID